VRSLWRRLVHKMTTRIDSGVSFALDRGSLIGLDCPQRLGKLSQAEVTQGKLLKAQSRELHFDGRRPSVRKADLNEAAGAADTA
jgi:hypothetical protein